MFIADVVVNLFTAYFDDTGLLIQDLKMIRHRYYKGWAIVDVPASFPFEIIMTPIMRAGGSRISSSIALFKMLKLPRFSALVASFAT